MSCMYILECVCTHRCLYDIKLYGGDGGQSDSQLPSRCGGQISMRLLQDLHVSHPALQQTAPLRTAPTANRTTVAPPRPRLTTQCTAPTHRPHCPIHLPPPCFSGRTAGASWRFLAGRKPISTSREARQRWQCPVTSTTRTAILSPPGTAYAEGLLLVYPPQPPPPPSPRPPRPPPPPPSPSPRPPKPSPPPSPTPPPSPPSPPPSPSPPSPSPSPPPSKLYHRACVFWGFLLASAWESYEWFKHALLVMYLYLSIMSCLLNDRCLDVPNVDRALTALICWCQGHSKSIAAGVSWY